MQVDLLMLSYNVQKLKMQKARQPYYSNSKWKLISSLSWRLVCSILCLIQLVDMIELYMKYEMNVETLNYPRDPIVPPAISLVTQQATSRQTSPSKELFAQTWNFAELVNNIVIMPPQGFEQEQYFGDSLLEY